MHNDATHLGSTKPQRQNQLKEHEMMHRRISNSLMYLRHSNWPQKLFQQIVWFLVEEMRPCFQSLENVYGH